jgi:hypothetical protein
MNDRRQCGADTPRGDGSSQRPRLETGGDAGDDAGVTEFGPHELRRMLRSFCVIGPPRRATATARRDAITGRVEGRACVADRAARSETCPTGGA